MAILINTKKEHSNVIYLDDYLDSRPGRVRRPMKDFDRQLADLNREIAKHKREADIIDKEIADYNKEAEEASEELKAKLFSAGDKHGKD